jgi:ribosome assembly protein YihI (activator of Der GTPase)
MTAADIIAQIKILDPLERAKVLDTLLQIKAESKNLEMDDQHFNQAADGALERHAELLRKLAQ